MKILTPKIHGILDYAAAAALIAAPLVIGLTGLALWLSIAAGVGLILYSLTTDYNASIAKLIPFRVHLILDGVAAVAMVIAPFAFGWTGAAMTYYLVMGGGVLLVVALSASKDPLEQESIRISGVDGNVHQASTPR